MNHKYFFKSKKFLSVDAKPAKRCPKMAIFPTMAVLRKKQEKLIPQYILYTDSRQYKAQLSIAIRDIPAQVGKEC